MALLPILHGAPLHPTVRIVYPREFRRTLPVSLTVTDYCAIRTGAFGAGATTGLRARVEDTCLHNLPSYPIDNDSPLKLYPCKNH